MTRVLKISADLSLPLDALTQTIAILAKRRVGKSYTMRRLVEQLFKAGQQVVIVDPKGDQWGIRSAADGKAPGLAVTILGGERGDLPLVPTGGEVVAKLVVEERVSMLLDISLFRKHEVATFMTAFLENLYRLKAREIYRTPMMLVIDEADAIAPQKPQKGEERMLGAAEDVVRRGGQRGIGCVLVTQRSAVLNKNVLTQAQMLVALRTIAPQDLAAMDAWIQVHGEPGQRKTLMESLPSLPVGDAWFWSPGWPTVEGIFQRVHVLPIETFDSGATPKPGEKRIEPKQAADVDLEALKRQMAATIEKAKAEDPKELRKQLAEVKKQLQVLESAKQRSTPPKDAQHVETKIIEKPVLKEGQLARIEKVVERFGEYVHRLTDMPAWAKDLPNAIQGLASTVNAVKRAEITNSAPISRTLVNRPAATLGPVPVSRAGTVRSQKPAPDSGTGEGLSTAQQAILNAAAFLESLGIDQPNVVQLALFAGQSASGGYWRRNVGRCRTLGLIEATSLTEAGRARATEPDITTVEELHKHVMENLLEGAQRQIMRVLIDAYPEELSAEEVGQRAQLEPAGGYWRRCVGRIRSLGLMTKKGPMAALPVLFLEGAAR